MTEAFNLIDEPWIPVIYADGRYQRVGIRTALEQAGGIRQIAASNPMDRVALLRFLLAVLLWCKDDAKTAIATLDGNARGIPEVWLGNLDDQKTAFNLLGDATRFYQDASLKCGDSRPIADLLVEFPGADSVNHMRHVVHGSYGFCPACCALGIVRLSVWAPANRYYPASVNPGTAAYAITERRNLLQTLAANLPESVGQVSQAPWLLDAPPGSPDAVAHLAWRPRRLWLNVAGERGSCANCSGFGVLVESLSNEGGWPTPTTGGQMREGDTKTKKFWDADPHLLRDGEAISLPGLASDAAAHASKFWRDALRLRGERTGKVVAVGPVVNKFSFQDASSVAVQHAAAQTRAKLSGDCSENLRGSLKLITPNPDRQHPEIKAALVLLTPETERRIRSMLNEPDAKIADATLLHEIFEPLVDQVVASTAKGSPLWRRAAGNHARELLSNKIKDLIQKATPAPTTADAGAASAFKPETNHKKRNAGK